MKRAIVVLAIIGGLAVCGELMGALLFFFQTGALIYLPRDQAIVSQSPERIKNRQRLHPYFGFTGQYSYQFDGQRLYTNSLGFLQREPLNIPVSRGPTDFVVTIFGGSVAEHVAIGPYGPTLRDKLEALPALSGKNIVVINMAQGSGKQPQQLLELAYLLALEQKIDLVINVDGFNEFALTYQNHAAGLNSVLPSVQIIKPLALEMSAGPATAEYYNVASQVLTKRQALSYQVNALRQSRSGVSFLKASILATWYRVTLAKSTSEYESLLVEQQDWGSLKARFGLDLPASENIFESAFNLWLRGSQQMKVLSESNGSAFLHVIQPNQYYSKHLFSEHERLVAFLQSNHEYRLGVEGGYPLFAQRKKVLETNGIASGVDLFDTEAQEVHVDNCCHYTALGLNLFLQFISENVARRLH
jgi:hypothetical protein